MAHILCAGDTVATENGATTWALNARPPEPTVWAIDHSANN
jgi:hypothetical protein